MNSELWRGCFHPRTPENTYEYDITSRPTAAPRKACRICAIARALARYHGRNERRAKERHFCPACVAGACADRHRKDGRCFRAVDSSETALVCACGAAWALGWPALLGTRPRRAMTVTNHGGRP